MNLVRLITRGSIVLALTSISEPASGQRQQYIARCLAIQDIDQRVDCLEGVGTAATATPQPLPPPRSSRDSPSFDCRTATHSIERAICGDATLSDFDARMGQQYQQALRLRKPNETQSLVDQQRSWIQQRNTACGAVAGNVVWSCVLDMTKQRIAALSLAPQSIEAAPVPQSTSLPQAAAQIAPKIQVVPSPSQPSAAQVTPAPQPVANPKAPVKETASEGANPLLVIIFMIGAIIGGILVFKSVQRRARRQRLVARFGEQIADMIIAHNFWLGMTEEQLKESRGPPVDRDYEVKKSITKETWKYGQTGKNRFELRIYLENGFVTGWKN